MRNEFPGLVLAMLAIRTEHDNDDRLFFGEVLDRELTAVSYIDDAEGWDGWETEVEQGGIRLRKPDLGAGQE